MALALFDEAQFDTVCCRRRCSPCIAANTSCSEMAARGAHGVCFPNFGYWPHGWSILRGRIPVTGQMPYQWYNTPNIHLCTLRSLRTWPPSWACASCSAATFNR